jgi:hypothetical protein
LEDGGYQAILFATRRTAMRKDGEAIGYKNSERKKT